MTRVEVVMARDQASATLRAVHRTGLLHLAPGLLSPGRDAAAFVPGGAAAMGAVHQPALAALDDLLALVGVSLPEAGRVAELWELGDEALLRSVEAMAPLRERAAALRGEAVRLEGELARLEGYRRLIEGLGSVVGRLPSVRGYGTTGIVIGARHQELVPLLREELETMTQGRCELVAGELGGDRIAAVLLYPTRQASEVRRLLGERDLEEVTLPDELIGVPIDELGPRLEAQEAQRRERRTAIDAELGAMRARHGPEAAALRRVLEDRVAEARALAAAMASDHLVVLTGWLPTRQLEAFRASLVAAVGSKVLVLARPVGRHPDPGAPVAFENPPWVRPFESLASFVVVPRAGTLDPTPLLAATFPAFVGLMVGDAGYGLVLLGLLLLLRRRFARAPVFATIWPIGLLAALSTILFGLLFGEWFGEAGRDIFGLAPLWLDRREAVLAFLVLALSIGVVQVGLGLVLGVVNAALDGHRRELAGRSALLAAFGSVLVLLAALVGLLPGGLSGLAAATLLVAILLVVTTIGMAGPVEIIGALGAVLSYARLMAIGLASVMLALVANRLGGLAENVLVGALVAGALHALNLVLGVFDSSVQGLRLHYVEFFSRFVEPGGVRYRPFVSALGPGSAGAMGGSMGGA